MKKTIRILSLLLALVFLLSLAPMAAFADGDLTEEQLLQLQQEEEERRQREAQEAAEAAARAAADAQKGAQENEQKGAQENTQEGTQENTQEDTERKDPPVRSVRSAAPRKMLLNSEPAQTQSDAQQDGQAGDAQQDGQTGDAQQGGKTVIPDNQEGKTLSEVKANEEMDTNKGTVTTNNGEININTGTVEENNGTVNYNAGGTVNGGTVKNNGYGLNLNNFLTGTARNFYGTDVVANSDKTAAFVPKNTSDLGVIFDHQDGYDMIIDNGGVGYSAVYNAGVWMVSFDKVVNNLKIFFTKAVERKPSLDEQYMDFINSVVRKIREAEKNSTVEIDAGYWLSYRTEVFQALADRPDVSLRTTYRRDGKTMRFTIPAGTDVLTAVYPEVVVEYPKLAQLLHITPEQVK